MFFTITKEPTHNLSNKTVIGDWTVMTDDGWQIDHVESSVVITKGLGSVDCRIKCDGRDWDIETNGLRRFPLWRAGDSVSNVYVTPNKIHNPSNVRYLNGNLLVDDVKETQWSIPSKTNILSRNDLEEQICASLLKQANILQDHELPIIAPNTMGVDCALVRAVLDYSGIEYSSTNITKHRLEKSHLTDKSFWGYGQMLNEGLPHIQATGYNGDAYMSRQPLYVALYLRKWGIDIIKEFDKAGPTYMKGSFDRYFRKQLETYDFPDDPDSKLVDMLINDLQIWHIDNCFTWTPLANTEIMRLGLAMDPDTALDQVLNAGLSRSLIKRLSPRRLTEIQQNHNGNSPV